MTTTYADHRPYVEAVVAAAERLGLEVLGHQVAAQPPAPRTAVISLAPSASGPYADEDVALAWDESFGWKAVVPAEAGTSDWFMGETLVPAPDRVARWTDMLLAHPEMTPSQENGPTRFPEDDDPAFEAQLSVYAASA